MKKVKQLMYLTLLCPMWYFIYVIQFPEKSHVIVEKDSPDENQTTNYPTQPFLLENPSSSMKTTQVILPYTSNSTETTRNRIQTSSSLMMTSMLTVQETVSSKFTQTKAALDSKSKNIITKSMKKSIYLVRVAPDSGSKKITSPKLITKKTIYPVTLTGKYVLNNPQICSDSKQVDVLIIVKSAVNHFSRRRNIRSTYGSKTAFLPKQVRVAFLLGLTSNRTLTTAVLKEHKTFGDIIQGDFIDSYHNLTHKGVMGLRWISEFCSNSKYIVKLDDDVVFDTGRFLKHFRDTSNVDIWCNIYHGANIHREGKWAVAKHEFKGLTHYPWSYCLGYTVILKTSIIKPLYKAAFQSPFFWIDDVYLYGILKSRAGARMSQVPKDMRLEQFKRRVKPTLACLSRKNCGILGVCVFDQHFMDVWKKFKTRK